MLYVPNVPHPFSVCVVTYHTLRMAFRRSPNRPTRIVIRPQVPSCFPPPAQAADQREGNTEEVRLRTSLNLIRVGSWIGSNRGRPREGIERGWNGTWRGEERGRERQGNEILDRAEQRFVNRNGKWFSNILRSKRCGAPLRILF